MMVCVEADLCCDSNSSTNQCSPNLLKALRTPGSLGMPALDMHPEAAAKPQAVRLLGYSQARKVKLQFGSISDIDEQNVFVDDTEEW